MIRMVHPICWSQELTTQHFELLENIKIDGCLQKQPRHQLLVEFNPLLLTLNSETSFHHFSGILAPKIATKNTVVLARFFDLPRFVSSFGPFDHQLTTPWFLRSRNALIFEASSPAFSTEVGQHPEKTHCERQNPWKNPPPPKKKGRPPPSSSSINVQVDFRLVSGRVFTSAKLRNLWNLFYK